jgi:hypothetical protein
MKNIKAYVFNSERGVKLMYWLFLMYDYSFYIYIFEIVVEIYFQSVFTWKYIKILLFLFFKKINFDISISKHEKNNLKKKSIFFLKTVGPQKQTKL